MNQSCKWKNVMIYNLVTKNVSFFSNSYKSYVFYNLISKRFKFQMICWLKHRIHLPTDIPRRGCELDFPFVRFESTTHRGTRRAGGAGVTLLMVGINVPRRSQRHQRYKHNTQRSLQSCCSLQVHLNIDKSSIVYTCF